MVVFMPLYGYDGYDLAKYINYQSESDSQIVVD